MGTEWTGWIALSVQSGGTVWTVLWSSGCLQLEYGNSLDSGIVLLLVVKS
jgi:hypothetical protein